jgi:hypothetical protein
MEGRQKRRLATRPGHIAGDWRGASLVEYIILVALIAFVAMLGFRAFGGSVDTKVRCLAAAAVGGGSTCSNVDRGVSAGAGLLAPAGQMQTAAPAPSGTTAGKRPSDSLPREILDAGEISAAVRHALDVLSEYNVKVNLRHGGGSFHDAAVNEVTLDMSRPTILEFVHEANHAQYFNNGTRADAMSVKRQEYIDAMLDEETEGDMLAIQTLQELKRHASPAGRSKISSAYYDRWERFYADAFEAAQKQLPQATSAELEAVARDRLRTRLREDREKGRILASSNNMSYAVYYGQWWDKVHAKR